MTLVDSNVLIDILDEKPDFLDSSLDALAAASERGAVLIIDVIFAEVSLGFQDARSTEAGLAALGVERMAMDAQALHLAGQTYRHYRRRGGTRTGVLADFFIGAAASVAGMPLLTRDEGRFATYFPEVPLIVPGRATG